MGFFTMTKVEEVLASYLSPLMAGNLERPALPSKLCKATSALVGKAYIAVGFAYGSLHTMAVLQAYQADLLNELDNREVVVELCRAMDLSLRLTKQTTRYYHMLRRLQER